MSDDTDRPTTLRWVHARRQLDAPPDRAYRAWSQPEELSRWFPHRVEGSLAPGTRTGLVWPDRRTWWDIVSVEPNTLFAFRWPWLPDESHVSMATVRIEPRGYGSVVTLEDGPFDTAEARLLDAYAEACAGWGEAFAMLRAVLDFSVDIRRFR
jgi:uncharacterized protein YndB with AHSA1/START domain